ncbi:MAG: TSUP family transporter, partial [Oscillospiraceae bacterium]
ALPDKREYRANTNLYFAMSNLSSTLVRLTRGIITLRLLGWWVLALAAIAAGTQFGNRIFRRIDAALMRKAVYGFMAVSGGIMLLG